MRLGEYDGAFSSIIRLICANQISCSASWKVRGGSSAIHSQAAATRSSSAARSGVAVAASSRAASACRRARMPIASQLMTTASRK